MLEKQLQEFAKSDKFKSMVAQKRKAQIFGPSGGSGSSGGSGTSDEIHRYAQELKKMLEDRVSKIRSRKGNDFLNDISIETKPKQEVVNGKEYITIGVSFGRKNSETTISESLYPQKYKDVVYMPLIVNNQWKKPKNYAYGNYRGVRIRSALEWPYKDQKGFMAEVIKGFNDKTPDYVKAEMHVAYDGGTFGSGTLYKDINY